MSVSRIHCFIDLKVRLSYLPRSSHSLMRENEIDKDAYFSPQAIEAGGSNDIEVHPLNPLPFKEGLPQ